MVTRMGELRDTDRSLPVTMRKPPISSPVMEVSAGAPVGASMTSLLSPRKIMEWVLTTKMTWLSLAVCRVSPGLMGVLSVAGWSLTRTLPLRL